MHPLSLGELYNTHLLPFIKLTQFSYAIQHRFIDLKTISYVVLDTKTNFTEMLILRTKKKKKL